MVAPVVEFGVLLAHAVDEPVLDAIDRARSSVGDELRRVLPDFDWRLPLVRRASPAPRGPAAITRLLLEGVQERDLHHWDFALVVTTADLDSHHRENALAAPARTVDTAVVSTARLLPDRGGDAGDREVVARRLHALWMHLLGDLCGVDHAAGKESYMAVPETAVDLDERVRFADAELAAIAGALALVADARLEETEAGARMGALSFHLQVLRIGGREILHRVLEARPWELPFRLTRLLTAAVGSTVLLLFTAEAWELGLRQPAGTIAALAVLAVGLTTALILRRQQLLLRGSGRRLNEQVAMMNVTVLLVVTLGVLATFALVLLLAAAAAWLLFDPPLMRSWAPSVADGGNGVEGVDGAGGMDGLGGAARWTAATFTAAIGTVIGGLGATFEGSERLRHVLYVDEEV